MSEKITMELKNLEEIKSVKKQLSVLSIPGIYFLFRNDKIIYIGQSRNVYSRLLSHPHKKYADSFSIFRYNPCELLAYEMLYIGKYNPPLNFVKIPPSYATDAERKKYYENLSNILSIPYENLI